MFPSIPAQVWTGAVLIVLMTTKHYIADFLLQTNWIAVGKEARRHWVMPLTAHAGCHALMTLLVTLSIVPGVWWLAPVDFVVHFAIDKSKTTVGHAAQLTPQDEKFWWLLGFDQYLHQLTNIVFAVVLFLALSSPEIA